MEVDSQTLERARRYQRDAVERLFAAFYPVVCRMALALSGRVDAGTDIVRVVVKRGFQVLPRWRDDGAPERWFHHHTVLAARRSTRAGPELSSDVFVTTAQTRDAGYPAFIRALRLLPHQQREAFILHHGEHMNTRYLAVAMDCSTEAAQNHLAQATESLKLIAGQSYLGFLKQLGDCYRQLSPAEEMSLPSVRKYVARFIWPRRVAAVLRAVFVVATLSGLAYLAWKIYPMIDY